MEVGILKIMPLVYLHMHEFSRVYPTRQLKLIEVSGFDGQPYLFKFLLDIDNIYMPIVDRGSHIAICVYAKSENDASFLSFCKALAQFSEILPIATYSEN